MSSALDICFFLFWITSNNLLPLYQRISVVSVWLGEEKGILQHNHAVPTWHRYLSDTVLALSYLYNVISREPTQRSILAAESL